MFTSIDIVVPDYISEPPGKPGGSFVPCRRGRSDSGHGRLSPSRHSVGRGWHGADHPAVCCMTGAELKAVRAFGVVSRTSPRRAEGNRFHHPYVQLQLQTEVLGEGKTVAFGQVPATATLNEVEELLAES